MNPKVTRFMLKSLYPKVNDEEVNSNTSTSFRIVRLDVQDPERDDSLSEEARKVKTSWTR